MKIRIKNLFSVGTILAAIALILSIVSFSLYGANVAGAGYFQGYSSGLVATCSSFAIITLLAYIALSIFDFGNGIVSKVLSIVRSACIVVACICLVASGITFIGDRAEGLGYIFFSDSNVLVEVQTADNLSSSYGAIAGTVTYLVGWLFALVASFFHIGSEKHSEEKLTANI